MLNGIRRALVSFNHKVIPDGKFCKTCGKATLSKKHAVSHDRKTGVPIQFKTIRYCINAHFPLTNAGEHKPWYGDG